MPDAPISFSTYFANTSTSRFTLVPGSALAEIRPLQRLWYQRNGKGFAIEPGHGQRDAVDGDRALLDDVAQHLRRGARSATRRANPSSVTAETVPDAVDVALDDVAAEAVARAQRQLEVDVRAGA